MTGRHVRLGAPTAGTDDSSAPGDAARPADGPRVPTPAGDPAPRPVTGPGVPVLRPVRRSAETTMLPTATAPAEAWRRIGPIRLDRVVPHRDALLLHSWLTHPASRFWQMDHLGLPEILAYELALAASPHEHAWLGRVAGRPTFMVETYDPARVLLDEVFDARPGDVGMHLLVAPPEAAPLHGLTDAVMAATLRFCFSTLHADRVVVEPDVHNAPIAAKNAAGGFRVVQEVQLGTKRAALSVCTREDFARSRLGQPPLPPAAASVGAVGPRRRARARRRAAEPPAAPPGLPLAPPRTTEDPS